MIQDEKGCFPAIEKSPYRDSFPETSKAPFFPFNPKIRSPIMTNEVLDFIFVTEFGTKKRDYCHNRDKLPL